MIDASAASNFAGEPVVLSVRICKRCAEKFPFARSAHQALRMDALNEIPDVNLTIARIGESIAISCNFGRAPRAPSHLIPEMEIHTFEFYALGSDCSLQLVTPNQPLARDAAVAAEREVTRIEARYSRYRPNSELSRINATAKTGGSVEVDAETAGLIDYAYAIYRMSDGLFDISSGLLRNAWNFSAGSLPSDSAIAELLPRIGLEKIQWSNPYLTFSMPGLELDFGGIGKEYAADRAASVCAASGVGHGLVNLGGDIRVIGPHPNGMPWRIGISHPRCPAAPIATVDLGSGALATSGDYQRFIEVGGRRYCHILNPRTGWPVRGLRSASVIGPDCLVAGSLATIAMLKGQEAIDWLAALGVRYVIMDDAGCISGTETIHDTAKPSY